MLVLLVVLASSLRTAARFLLASSLLRAHRVDALAGRQAGFRQAQKQLTQLSQQMGRGSTSTAAEQARGSIFKRDLLMQAPLAMAGSYAGLGQAQEQPSQGQGPSA